MQSTDDGTCRFLGCDRPHHAQRLCNGHYRQHTAGLSLTPLRRLVNGSVETRMDAYTDRSGECWLWTGGVSKAGYGRLRVDGSMVLAHRVAFELAAGPIPPDKTVDHLCHTLTCVRPEHLQLVSPTESAENRAGATRVSRSGIRGVYRQGSLNKWVVKVGHKRRLHHGGTFSTIEEAEAAAIALRIHLHTNNIVDRQA